MRLRCSVTCSHNLLAFFFRIVHNPEINWSYGMRLLLVLTDEPIMGLGVIATLAEREGWTSIVSDPTCFSANLASCKPHVVLIDLDCGSFNLLVEARRTLPE